MPNFRTSQPLLLALALSTAAFAICTARAQNEVSGTIPAPQDVDAVRRLYARAVRDGGLPALHTRLDTVARSGAPAAERANALVKKARLFWEAGDRAAATAGAEAALAIAQTADACLLKAELLDAAGQFGASVDWYRRAGAGVMRGAMERRVVMIAAMRRPEALAVFARSGVARGAATVAALLGRPGTAMALSRAGGEAKALADRLQLAGWALAAGDAVSARDAAWGAYGAATTVEDRRYALALLVEAYRANSDLAGAAAFLGGKPAAPELTRARVDVLLDLGRVDEALSLIEASADPTLRGRLLGVLDLAGLHTGRTDTSVAEYRRLIAAKPHQPQWYAGLAGLYLARGDEREAVATFHKMFSANRGRDDVLAAGARQMIAMGLSDQAIALLTAVGQATTPAVRLFLFEAYRDRGETARARQELEWLRSETTERAVLLDVADGFERIGDPAAALTILRGLAARGPPLDYDQRVRIAALAEQTGRQDEALERWRTLWVGETLPARRHYIERQIVRLAKDAGRLDRLAGDLDARLTSARAEPSDIDLLVALRLAQSDNDAAAAAVQRYSAQRNRNELATQRQLATLYARIGDKEGLDRTLRRLITIDPERRNLYARQRILTTWRSAGDATPVGARRAELDRLMADLGDTRESSSRRFRAAVYAMASLGDAALAQLRADAAIRPDDPDALLQLAAETAKNGRPDAAVAMLQHVALHAPTQNLFAGALEGLLDRVAAGSGGGPGRDALLDWSARMVLERIVSTDADGRLLGLLADIATMQSDQAMQVRALEASLPDAGDQRASVLREMVTIMAGPEGGQGEGPPMLGDPQRRVVYARRLLALGKAYPPDFYASLGRALLAQDDRAGAERAFAMMSDLSDVMSVEALKGDAYAAAGQTASALAYYARALIADRADLDLVVKTSILRERVGEEALAQRWYWEAERSLLARQPARAGGGDDDLATEVRRFHPTLTEGLLLTWPADAQRRREVLSELQRMFDAALAELDAAAPGMLADHPRLALVVDLGWRIADAGLDDGVVALWDAKLDRSFAGDPAYRQDTLMRRYLTGRATIPSDGPEAWPLVGLGAQAAASKNTMLLLSMALARGDMGSVRSLTLEALAAEVALRNGSMPGQSALVPVLLTLMERLPAATFQEMVLQPLDASPIRDAFLFDLFRGLPERYDRLEKVAGRNLLSEDQLVRSMIVDDGRALPFSTRAFRSRSGLETALARFPADALMTVYEGLMSRAEHGASDSLTVETLLSRLFARPLSAPQQARLLALMRRDLGRVRVERYPSVGQLLPRVVLLDADVANRPLLIEVARFVAERYPDGTALPGFLEAWFARDRAAALPRLMTLAQAVNAQPGDGGWFDRALQQVDPDADKARVAAFMAAPAPDRAAAADFYERFVTNAPGTMPEDLVRYYAKLLTVDPRNPIYLSGLMAIHAGAADWAALAPLIARHVAAQPEDRDAATMLALVYLLLNRSDEAAVVERAAGVDIHDAGWLARTFDRASSAPGDGPDSMRRLFLPVFAAYRERFPKDPVIAAITVRNSAASGDTDQQLHPLVELAAKDPAGVPGLLRQMWRNTLAVSGDGPQDEARSAFVQALLGADAAAAPVLARADVMAEIGRFVAVMEPQQQARARPLYHLVAGGGAVSAGTHEDEKGGHAVRLAIAIADRSPVPLTPSQRDALVHRAAKSPAMTPDERIALARVLGRGGGTDAAGELLQSAMIQLLYPQTPLDVATDATAPDAIVAALRLWPDRAAARKARDALAARLQTELRGGLAAGFTALPPLEEQATDSSSSTP